MGSVLSFPILCIANLIGYIRAYVKYFKDILPEYKRGPND